MSKEYYKGRICYDCTFFYPEESGWQNKCLHCRGFTILNYIRDTVLPYDKCDKYKKQEVETDSIEVHELKCPKCGCKTQWTHEYHVKDNKVKCIECGRLSDISQESSNEK